jgi:hypothetical protein
MLLVRKRIILVQKLGDLELGPVWLFTEVSIITAKENVLECKPQRNRGTGKLFNIKFLWTRDRVVSISWNTKQDDSDFLKQYFSTAGSGTEEFTGLEKFPTKIYFSNQLGKGDSVYDKQTGL